MMKTKNILEYMILEYMIMESGKKTPAISFNRARIEVIL